MESLIEFRKQIWTSGDGKLVPFKYTPIGELQDEHLANIINHCKIQSENYPPSLIFMLEIEASSRKLTKKFLDRGPIPWKHQDRWMMLNEDTQTYEVIGR